MPVEVVPVASYSAVVQGLQAGHIDVAELGPATCVQMLQRGATLNLVDPASTSGALLPGQAVLAHTGQALEVFFSRVSYAGSHARALAAVRAGRVDAALVSSQSLETALLRGIVARGELRTLWVSAPLPTDPLVLRKKLCPALKALGMQALVAVDESDYAGVAALLGINGPGP